MNVIDEGYFLMRNLCLQNGYDYNIYMLKVIYRINRVILGFILGSFICKFNMEELFFMGIVKLFDVVRFYFGVD